MKLDPTCYESSSVHYYVPHGAGRDPFLYIPVSVGHFDCKPNYELQRNVFSSYLLLVMLAGSLSYQTRYCRGVARTGQVLLLDCNEPHAYAAQGHCSFSFLHFSGAQSKELYARIVHSAGNLITLQDPNTLYEAIGEMISAMQTGHKMKDTEASAMIYSMLMRLLEHNGPPASSTVSNTVVDRAIAFIQGHLADKINVEEIAASAGYSPSYFSHIFTQETGMSPYQFVIKSRVEQAQQLLKTTQLTVQEIAFQSGFNSAANFCYTFRRLVKKSPHEYRNEQL